MSSPTDDRSGTPAEATATFRIAQLNLLALVAVAFCMVPVAFGAPWFWLIYLVPLGLAIWVVRSRTTAAPDGVAARGVLRTTRVPWSDISALRLRSSWTRSRVSAVLSNGSELPLPAVRVRDLPSLAAASGGRLPDPSATPAAPPPAEPAPVDPEPHQPEPSEE
ncbi:MAG TPA: PH domain-containing protein [Nocardioides sp.]|nr:PH domain-containing protein [Nocardioides sp.]